MSTHIYKKRGFTLIEALVYLALLALLMTGMVRAAYYLFAGSGRDTTHAIVQEEGDFLIHKIAWSLQNAQDVTLPPAGQTGSTLSLSQAVALNPDGSASTTSVTAGLDPAAPQRLQFQIGNNPPEDLNDASLSIVSLQFYHATSSVSGAPDDSVGIYLTLSARTPDGILVSENFISTTSLAQ